MSDILSIVASITGLVTTGTTLTGQIYQFIDSIRSASSDLRDLARELGELCTILKKLEGNFSGGARHQELWVDLKDVLDSCMTKFIQLGALVKAHKCGTKDGWVLRLWRRGKWTFKEKEMRSLRTQLEAHKATLKITLLLSTHTETALIKDCTDRIEGAVREVIDRLISDGEDENTVARYPSNLTLQRHFSNTASVSCTYRGSVTEEERVDRDLGKSVEEVEKQKIQTTIDDEAAESDPEEADARAKRLLEEEAAAEQKQKSAEGAEVAMIQAVIEEERARYEAISKKRAEEFQRQMNQVLKAERAKTQATIDQERAKWESMDREWGKEPEKAQTNAINP